MKTQRNNYFMSAASLFFAILFTFLAGFVAFGEDALTIIRYSLLVLAVVPTTFLIGCTFEKTVYGTEEITFYKRFRKIGTLAWKDITEIGDVSMSLNQSTLVGSVPTYCVAYTKTHTVTPIINKYGKPKNKINGKRAKLNHDSSPLAWTFCTHTANNGDFIQHLKQRRPELLKSKNKKNNCIGYD